MIETERLILRQWRDADRAPYAALNADPEVMEHFERPLTRAEVDADIDWHRARLAEDGWGHLAVERRADGAFLGHVGVKPTGPDLPLGGDFEVGWQLARAAWGFGYASEAARAAVADGLARTGLPRIVAFTATTNLRSQAVMERVGLQRRPDLDFDHPGLPSGHRLQRHWVWALKVEETASRLS